MIRTVSFFFVFLALSLSSAAQSFDDLKKQAVTRYNSGDYAGAATYSKLALQKNSADKELHNICGYSLYKEGEMDEAEKSLKKALALDSMYFDAYINLVRLHGKTMRIEQAVSEVRKGLLLWKSDAEKAGLYFIEALVEMERKNFTAGRIASLNALRYDSTHTEAMYNYAAIMKKTKQLDSAIILLKKAVRISPQFKEAHNNLGTYLSDAGRYAESVAALDNAIKSIPDFYLFYNNRGYSKLMLKQYSEAETDIQQSIKLNGKHSYSYRNLGLVYLELKETAKACEAFRQALQLGFTKQYGDEVEKKVATLKCQ